MDKRIDWEILDGNLYDCEINATNQPHSRFDNWYDVNLTFRRGDFEYIIQARDQDNGAFNRLTEGFGVFMHYLLTKPTIGERVSIRRATYTVNQNSSTGNLELDTTNSRVIIIDHSKNDKKDSEAEE